MVSLRLFHALTHSLLSSSVAKNSYKAAAVQRAFLDADERFKNVVTRYSGRVGSALAYSSRSSGGSVLKEVLSPSNASDLFDVPPSPSLPPPS
jgi:hypothetical protein